MPGWRPPLLWRAAQLLARALVALLGRLRVTGAVTAPSPVILAANHIGPFDPIALMAACQARRIAPRFLAMENLFRLPLLGQMMRHWGHIPVRRGSRDAGAALSAAAEALARGSVLLVYPEGGIGLDPGMWPERGKTGVARLALATGAPVVPVAHWGSHEVVPYAAPRGLLRALPRAIRQRPTIRVRFGEPVDLTGLRAGAPKDVRVATDRIIDAITRTLAPLRADEPGRPRHVDPTRPVRSEQ